MAATASAVTAPPPPASRTIFCSKGCCRVLCMGRPDASAFAAASPDGAGPALRWAAAICARCSGLRVTGRDQRPQTGAAAAKSLGEWLSSANVPMPPIELPVR